MTTPPFKVKPMLSIGVTGHRAIGDPEALEAKLKTLIAEVLEILDDLSGAGQGLESTAGRLRLISPLAEGADQIFARAGLALGADLQCPLPFWRGDYRNDFTSEAARIEFDRLLGRAGSVFELDGDRAFEPEAYLEVGRVVIRHSDLLIAVWDGEPSRGKGGTADIVSEALAEDLAVIVIDPKPDGDAVLLRAHARDRRALSREVLEAALIAIIRPPPVDPPAPVAASGRFALVLAWAGRFMGLGAVDYDTFIQEKPQDAVPVAAAFGLVFDWTVNLFLGRLQLYQKREGEWTAASLSRWASVFEDHDDLALTCRPCVQGEPSLAFARADALASRYGGLYRSAFVSNFLLSALAVCMTIISEAFIASTNRIKLVCEGFEFFAILGVLVLTYVANRKNWHERWIEYRHLAEQLRPLRFLFPLGLSLPRPQVARPLFGKEHSSAWVEWLTRRIQRSLGLPNVVVDPAYVEAVRRFASDAVLGEQITYHDRNRKKMHEVEESLRLWGASLFAGSLVMCFVEIILSSANVGVMKLPRMNLAMPGAASSPLTAALAHLGPAVPFFFSGTLPALGAAFLGIRHVGEFSRLERRSFAMAAALGGAQRSLNLARKAGGKRKTLAPQLEMIALQMMSETAEWRTLVIAHHLEYS